MVAFLLYFIHCGWDIDKRWKSGLPTSGLPPLWTILSTFAIRIAHPNYNTNFHFISIDNADIWVIVYLMLGVWISFEYLFEWHSMNVQLILLFLYISLNVCLRGWAENCCFSVRYFIAQEQTGTVRKLHSCGKCPNSQILPNIFQKMRSSLTLRTIIERKHSIAV